MQYNPGFIPKQWAIGGQETREARAKAQTNLMEKGAVSVSGQEGLSTLQLGFVNTPQSQHDNWDANGVDNYGEGNWPGRRRRSRKMELASQFAEAAEQSSSL